MSDSHKILLIIRKLFTKILIIIIMVTVMNWPNVHAEVSLSREYKIKAAFLYNFAKFVDWPEEAFENSKSPITIGIIGEDLFGANLDKTISGKTVKGRNLLSKRFKTIHELEKCHILFINVFDKKQLSKIMNKLKDWHVLKVGETEGFTGQGGIISFIKEENRIRFEINIDEAERVGLKISSRLLKLAKIVRDRH